MSNYWQPLLRSGPPSSQTAATYGDLEQYLSLEGGNMLGTTTFGRNTLHVPPTGPVGNVSGISFFEFSSGSSSEVSGGVIFAPDNTTQGDLLITSPWFVEPSAAVNHHVRSFIQLFSSPSNDTSGAYITYGGNTHSWTISTAPDTYDLDAMRLGTNGLELDAVSGYKVILRLDDTDSYVTSDAADQINVYTGASERLRLDNNTRAAGALTAFTPTWTSTGSAPSIGNGTLGGTYWRVGNLVFFRWTMIIGSTTTVGTGTYSWALPVAARSAVYQTQVTALGTTAIQDQGTAHYHAMTVYESSTKFQLRSDANYSALVSATSPMAPATNDKYAGFGVYEAA